jgi:hypothetical protein
MNPKASSEGKQRNRQYEGSQTLAEIPTKRLLEIKKRETASTTKGRAERQLKVLEGSQKEEKSECRIKNIRHGEKTKSALAIYFHIFSHLYRMLRDIRGWPGPVRKFVSNSGVCATAAKLDACVLLHSANCFHNTTATYIRLLSPFFLSL